MSHDKKNPTIAEFVKRLVEETGITDDQALELVLLIGLNWSSLVREAKALRSGA